jgi:hypothetical protein
MYSRLLISPVLKYRRQNHESLNTAVGDIGLGFAVLDRSPRKTGAGFWSPELELFDRSPISLCVAAAAGGALFLLRRASRSSATRIASKMRPITTDPTTIPAIAPLDNFDLDEVFCGDAWDWPEEEEPVLEATEEEAVEEAVVFLATVS